MKIYALPFKPVDCGELKKAVIDVSTGYFTNDNVPYKDERDFNLVEYMDAILKEAFVRCYVTERQGRFYLFGMEPEDDYRVFDQWVAERMTVG